MKKIFLLIVCICLAFTVYAGRRSKHHSRRTRIIQYALSCTKCGLVLPDYKANKLPAMKGYKAKCPKCGGGMTSHYVTH